MLLITGPHGSGKSAAVLSRVRDHLGRRDWSFRLLVPTATLAEHLRNDLAREGFTFPASVIQTFSKFVSTLAPMEPVHPAALELAIEEAAAAHPHPRVRDAARWPGFRRSIAGAIEELSSAGCDSAQLSALLKRAAINDAMAADLAAIYASVERRVSARGWHARASTLEAAATAARAGAARTTAHSVYIDGFAQFTALEVALLVALAGHADVTVTLPEWPGASYARSLLLHHASEQRFAERRRPLPDVTVITAADVESEVREVARRILDLHARGAEFRGIGVILRSAEPFGTLLQREFERFGIPARRYFGEPAAEHAAIRYLTGVLDAMRRGWDHSELSHLLSSTPAGAFGKIEAFRFNFALREGLPGNDALDKLSEATESSAMRRALAEFSSITAWREASARPSAWADRIGRLATLVRYPNAVDNFDTAEVDVWRSLGAAVQAWKASVEQAGRILPADEEVTFDKFRRALDAVLAHTELRVHDRRRNVVHVMDAYEARQWELPHVFVCGLLEKQFPKHHAESPILDTPARRRLQMFGVNLRTAADWQEEEQYLFEIATSRASRTLTLTHAAQNAKGEENLTSFALERFLQHNPARRESTAPARPRAPRSAPALIRPGIRDEELLTALSRRHTGFGPTSIESFLQCPFQFFARKTLALREAPDRPEERLNALAQGSIVHSVLSRLPTQGDIDQVFEEAFERECRERRVVAGYRSEYIRYQMHRALSAFSRSSSLSLGWRVETEKQFEFTLAPGLKIRGRIDRLDIAADGRALIIDYKYSPPERLKQIIASHDEGLLVQGGLYMLAAKRCFDYRPAGMVFAGVKKQFQMRGWHFDTPLGEPPPLDAATVQQVIDKAVDVATAAAGRIASGHIETAPANPDKCRFCDYADICRVETAAVTVMS